MRSKFKWIYALLVALTMQFSFAQEKTITGVVSDANGALPGVNVVVKGTQRGATTGFDGGYSIKAKEGETLVFSYMSFNEVTRVVGASNAINVTMQEEVTKINEIVISGVRKKIADLPGSVKVVKNSEIVQAGAINAVQGLIGKVSGLQINTTSNNVNTPTRIVLNGIRSITGPNTVLVVIDGAISSAGILQQLPPEIIESTTIVKGAQGSALYGEQGSNGVIVVTTKKGNAGKIAVTVNSLVDFQSVSYLPRRQTRYGQGWFGNNIAEENGSWGPLLDGSIRPVGLPQADGSFITAPFTGNSDNIKKFFQTGVIYQNGVSINAGNINDGYAVMSVNRQDREFVIKGDEFRRTNILFKAGKNFGKLSVEGNVQYYNQKTKNSGVNPLAGGANTLFGSLLQTATNIPVELFENSGNNGHWTVYTRSPYWHRDNVRNSNTSDFFNGILTLKYKFNNNIDVMLLGNVNTIGNVIDNHTNAFSTREDIYNGLGFGARVVRSTLFQQSTNSRNLYSDLVVNFKYKLIEDLELKASIGSNIQDRFRRRISVGGNDLNIPGLYNYENILQPTLASGLNNDVRNDRRLAAFGNIDLSYADYLNLNLTARNDWSSSLYKDNRSFFYPGAGLTFTPTNAFKSLKGNVLNTAKVYLGYTKVGTSAAIDPYEIDAVGQTALGFPFTSGTAPLPSTIIGTTQTDNKIKPEFNTTKDFGLSLGFFNDRITFDGQYYITDVDDLITDSTTSSSSGIVSLKSNVGKLQTKGYNLDLGFVPIKNDNFTWETKFNLSHNKTIIVDLAKGADEVNLQTATNGLVGIFAVKGEEFPMIKGIGYERDAQGRVIIDATTGVPLYSSKFKNFGSANPDYILGFSNSFDYKGLKLVVVGDYRTGHKFFSETREQLAWTGNLIESAENGRTGFIFPNSVVTTATPGVYAPNTNTVSGGVTPAQQNSYQAYQTFFENDNNGSNAENNILDATALKIREIALSYSLPSKFLKGTGITAASFGINARNPFIFLPKTNKYYSDPEASNAPEVSTNAQNSNAIGIANIGQYPFTRTYGFVLNLTF